MEKNKFIYLDNSATTRLRPEVLEAMTPYLTDLYGNPSSIYELGRTSLQAITEARKSVADAIGAAPKEIFFTGCGSEADNWALKGVAHANQKRGKHIVTSAIEHHAILHSLKHLEKEGFEVTYLPVDRFGMIDPAALEKTIREDTILVTIMMANNEIGTIEPIQELAAIAKAHRVLFHTDAVQAVGSIPVDVNALGVDLLSLSAHKFGGPKGVGALYIRQGTRIETLIDGGGQENRRRAGTENVAGIVGLGKAITLATANLEEKGRKLTALREKLKKGVMERIPDVLFNGHPEKRLPGNANFCFKYIEGESLLLSLDMYGVAGSSGSACTSGSLDPSHVLLAIGLPHETAHGSLRLSMSVDTTEDEIEETIEAVTKVVKRLREMSPLTPAGYQC